MFQTVPVIEATLGQCKKFHCNSEPLNDYLKRFATGNHRKNIGKTFVLFSKQNIIGYYTISMGNVDFRYLPARYQTGLPKYPIPVARIGRLAVASEAQGQGFGKILIVDAFKRIWEASQMIASYAVIVDAKDDKAVSFYEHFGFCSFENEKMSLFLPLTALRNFF